MDTNHWVDAAPFRRHVRWLISATGLSWRLIAAHANVAPRAIQTLLHGRLHTGKPVDRIHIDTARALMNLDLHDLDTAEDRMTCANDARSLFHILRTLGYTDDQLSRWLTTADLQVLSNQRELWCSAAAHARAQACHDVLTAQQPPRPIAPGRPSNRTHHPGQLTPTGSDASVPVGTSMEAGPLRIGHR